MPPPPRTVMNPPSMKARLRCGEAGIVASSSVKAKTDTLFRKMRGTPDRIDPRGPTLLAAKLNEQGQAA